MVTNAEPWLSDLDSRHGRIEGITARDSEPKNGKAMLLAGVGVSYATTAHLRYGQGDLSAARSCLWLAIDALTEAMEMVEVEHNREINDAADRGDV